MALSPAGPRRATASTRRTARGSTIPTRRPRDWTFRSLRTRGRRAARPRVAARRGSRARQGGRSIARAHRARARERASRRALRAAALRGDRRAPRRRIVDRSRAAPERVLRARARGPPAVHRARRQPHPLPRRQGPRWSTGGPRSSSRSPTCGRTCRSRASRARAASSSRATRSPSASSRASSPWRPIRATGSSIPFLGSGTTAAVAHKMKRRWIGIESGDHLTTLAEPRLRARRRRRGHDRHQRRDRLRRWRLASASWSSDRAPDVLCRRSSSRSSRRGCPQARRARPSNGGGADATPATRADGDAARRRRRRRRGAGPRRARRRAARGPRPSAPTSGRRPRRPSRRSRPASRTSPRSASRAHASRSRSASTPMPSRASTSSRTSCRSFATSIAKARAQAALVAGPFDRAAEWYGDPFAAVGMAHRPPRPGRRPASPRARARSAIASLAVDKQHARARGEGARAPHARHRARRTATPPPPLDARWLATNALDDAAASAATELLEKLQRPAPAHGRRARRARARPRRGGPLRRRAPRRRARRQRARPGKPASLRSTLPCARGGLLQGANALPRGRARVSRVRRAWAARAPRRTPSSPRAPSRAPIATATRSLRSRPSSSDTRKTTWADQAEFHVARAHALAGRWKEAAHALDEYVKHFPTGHDKREAERYRAVSHLMARDDKIARKLLEDLAGGADDALIAGALAEPRRARGAARRRSHACASRAGPTSRAARPLSWPALVARARLTAANAPLPAHHRSGRDRRPDRAARHRAAAAGRRPASHRSRRRRRGGAPRARVDRRRERAGSRHRGALREPTRMLDRGKRRYQISLQIPSALLASAPGPQATAGRGTAPTRGRTRGASAATRRARSCRPTCSGR